MLIFSTAGSFYFFYFGTHCVFLSSVYVGIVLWVSAASGVQSFFFSPRSPERSARERVRFNGVERKTHNPGKLSTSNRAIRTSGYIRLPSFTV